MDIYDKLPQNDIPIIIKDDVWTWANIIILKGVTISRDSIIEAIAVVIKSCLAHSLIGVIPAKIIKYRFSIEGILSHEKILYKEISPRRTL